MAMKHGYDSVEEYKAGAQEKFSLLEGGIIQKPATRLLLINVSPNLSFRVASPADTRPGHARRLDAHRRLDDALRARDPKRSQVSRHLEHSAFQKTNGLPRFIPGALHMGYPAANDYVYPWMESVMASHC